MRERWREWIGPVAVVLALIALAAAIWAFQRARIEAMPPATPRPTSTAQPAPTSYLDDDEDADEGPTPVPDDPVEIQDNPEVDYDD